jgi:hypothetical protein
MKADTREPNQVITMISSHDDEYLAVITGKKLIKDNVKTNQLFVFRCQPNSVSYIQIYRVDLAILQFFKNICLQFYFSKTKENCLIFVVRNEIFQFNYMTGQYKPMHTFSNPLESNPIQFEMVTDQNEQFIVASKDSCVKVKVGSTTEAQEYQLEGMGIKAI